MAFGLPELTRPAGKINPSKMSSDLLDLKPGLYVTATPIGNLGDITYRAVASLKAADLILCEDTRQTAKLCAAYDIRTPRSPYHDHNGARVRPDILRRLEDGARICLVSDAGTPVVADPGFKLVREARERGLAVFALPGPCAAIAALSAAGTPSDQFCFAGFAPARPGQRKRFLEDMATAPGTLIFYETGPRLGASLKDMYAVLGERRAVIARELTKLHEEFVAGDLETLSRDHEEIRTKGEFVILIAPAEAAPPGHDALPAFMSEALKTMPVKKAAAEAAMALGVMKRDAYQVGLRLQGSAAGDGGDADDA